MKSTGTWLFRGVEDYTAQLYSGSSFCVCKMCAEIHPKKTYQKAEIFSTYRSKIQVWSHELDFALRKAQTNTLPETNREFIGVFVLPNYRDSFISHDLFLDPGTLNLIEDDSWHGKDCNGFVEPLV